MPDYGAAAGDGVVVASVREGSPAAKAGLEAGDLIVALAGVAVTDVEQYTEVLDAQKIGSTVPVRVRREGAEAELQVVVGSRSR
jgi:S1-C subfamily serine protease